MELIRSPKVEFLALQKGKRKVLDGKKVLDYGGR